MQAFFEAEKRDGLILDGTVASDKDHIAEIWRLRENISVALNKAGEQLPVSASCQVPLAPCPIVLVIFFQLVCTEGVKINKANSSCRLLHVLNSLPAP